MDQHQHLVLVVLIRVVEWGVLSAVS